MKVISKVSTNSLIKDHEYDVESIYNDGNSKFWLEGKLSIEILGKFSVNNFKMPNGEDLPKIKIEKESLKLKNIKETIVNDILVCVSSNYTLFNKDSLYKVIDLKTIEKTHFNSKYIEKSVKFEGINRWIKLNPWNFRHLRDQEKREINLESILNDKDPGVVKSVKRKVDLEENKKDFIMKEISKSILDKKRHHLSVVEWVIEKSGKKSKLKKEDFDDILNMKLLDILNEIQ